MNTVGVPHFTGGANDFRDTQTTDVLPQATFVDRGHESTIEGTEPKI